MRMASSKTSSKKSGTTSASLQSNCSSDGDNIQVVVRVRPSSEIDVPSYSRAVSVDDNKTVIYLDTKPKAKSFKYDYVAKEETGQETMFNVLGRQLIDSCLDGYNGTIFAYGQTGSGKTYTMLGPAEESENFHHDLRGVIPRSFEYLFSCISNEREQHGEEKQFLCKCSFLEIYNESIFDLLEPSSSQLQLRESFKTGVYVCGIKEQNINSASEAYQVLTSGWINRRVASTAMNRESSRSHAVFTVYIESKEKKGGVDHIRTSMLNLVDLAGSERQKDTGAVGQRLREASQINKSLSNLGNVIMSLVKISSGKERYIPYRDSKLTFLLKDSLGGNAKTRLVACVHPGSKYYGETLSTLQFASRAKLIKNKAVLNEDSKGNIQALQIEIRQLKEALARCASQTPVVAAEDDLLVGSLREMFLQAMILQQRGLIEQMNLEERVRQLKEVCAKKDNFLRASKMVVKFRIADINRLKTELANEPQNRDEHVESLEQELDLLRGQLEQHPDIAQYRMEVNCLKNALQVTRSENLSNIQADKLRIKQLESKFKELIAEQQREEEEEVLKPATPRPDMTETLEKYKSLCEKLQTETSDLKQNLKETKEATEKGEVDMKSELEASKKYIMELEKVMSANNTKNKLERDALNEQHLKTVQTITTPKKECYKLRNRTVVGEGAGTPSLNDTIPYEDDIMAEKELADDMMEQANEALIQQLKECQTDCSELRSELLGKEAQIAKQEQTNSILEAKIHHFEELLSKEKTQSEAHQKQARSLEQKVQQLDQDCQFATSEVSDLKIILNSTDKKVDEYKKKCVDQKETHETETNQIMAKMIQSQLKIENLTKENEELLQAKEALAVNFENETQTVLYQETMIENLETEQVSLHRQVAELETVLQATEKAVLEEKQHSEELMLQMRAEGMEKENMLKKITDIQKLQTELVIKKNVIEGHEETTRLLRAELQKRDSKMAALDQRISQDDEQLKTQFIKLESLRREKESISELLKSTSDEKDTQSRLVEDLTQTSANLKKQLEEVNNEFTIQSQRHNFEMMNSSEDVIAITEQLKKEENLHAETRAIKEKLVVENEEIEKKLQNINNMVKDTSGQELEKLFGQIGDFHINSRHHHEEALELRAKIQELVKEKDQLRAERDAQCEKLVEKQRQDKEEMDRLKVELETKTTELSSVEGELKKLSEENIFLVGHQNTKQKIHYHEKVKKELETTKQQLSVCVCSSERRLKTLCVPQKENKTPFTSGDYNTNVKPC